MPISTIFTALFYPYIAQERTAQSAILSVRSELFALCLKERHRSQNQGSLKSEERKSDFKERCAQLCQILAWIRVQEDNFLAYLDLYGTPVPYLGNIGLATIYNSTEPEAVL